MLSEDSYHWYWFVNQEILIHIVEVGWNYYWYEKIGGTRSYIMHDSGRTRPASVIEWQLAVMKG